MTAASSPIRVTLEDEPPDSDLALVSQGLVDHARRCGVEERAHRRLAVLARDADGTLVGGLAGATVWGWLHVAELWVAEPHRGRGVGSGLVRAPEREARDRGCHHALLDTFDFQAREFYERLGYEVFASLPDFPHGHVRLFMQRRLDDARAGGRALPGRRLRASEDA